MMAEDGAVGYGKPPKHTRFKKGQSGNPKGRPKGAKSTQALLEEELGRLVPITENGRIRQTTMRQLIIRSNVAKAAKGSLPHLRWVEENDPARAEGSFNSFLNRDEPLTIVLDMGNELSPQAPAERRD